MGIAQRVVDIIAGRKAAGKIGKPDADGLVRSGIFNNGDIVGHGIINRAAIQPAYRYYERARVPSLSWDEVKRR